MRWIVTAPSVTAETNVGSGRARIDFPGGAVLPVDVPQEDIDRLSHLGQIMPEAIEETPAKPPADPNAVPAGTIEAILEWVGTDAERAQRALDAEVAGKNRATLVERLKALIAPAE